MNVQIGEDENNKFVLYNFKKKITSILQIFHAGTVFHA